MDDSLVQALARVYAAAYSASGRHQGMVAGTDPDEARENGRNACFAFLRTLKGIDAQRTGSN